MTPSLSPMILLTAKATFWLLLVCLAVLCLRRGSAAQRHVAWTTGLCGLLLLPLLSFALPGWPLPWPAESASAPVLPPPNHGNLAVALESDKLTGFLAPLPGEHGGDTRIAARGASKEKTPEAASVVVVAPVEHEPIEISAKATLSVPTILFSIWLAGALLMLARLALSGLMLRRLSRRTTLLRDGPLFDRARGVARELGLGDITLLVSAERTIPMTWGLLRAKVLLPEQAASWSEERLRLVLLHELGHVRRRDCLTQCLGLIARALFWFHPLAWLALYRQRVEQEQACDDLVLAQGAEAPVYAEHLLAITAGLPETYFAPPVALGMGRAASLGRRLVALLDGSRRRETWSRPGLLLFGACAAFLLTLGGLATWPQPASAARIPPPDMPVPADADAGEQDKEKKAADPKDAPKIDVDALWREVRKKLKETYVGPLDDKKLADAALRGLLDSLKDPYTDYLPPVDFKALEATTRGTFAGIGAQLKAEGDRIVVVTPIDGSPAHRAGLRPGDVVSSVDGKPLHGLTIQQAVEKIVGPKGTEVKLKVLHSDGVVEDLAIKRDLITVGTVEGFRRDAEGRWVFWLDPERKIGYVHIAQFGSGTTKDLRATIDTLQKDGLKGLVLDLRYCPGGLLNQALAACQLFLAKGRIVTIKGTGKEETVYEADGKAPFADVPLVVVVNEATASAAEIVAGALLDNDRALILGGRTFGKGSVQTIVNLETGGALKVTTAYYFLPSGRNIQKKPGEKNWGVDPKDGYFVLLSQAQTDALKQDHTRRGLVGFKKDEAPKFAERLTPKLLETEHHDPQLAAALKTLTARLTGGEFVPVGKSAAQAQEQLLRLDELRQKREQLMRNLKALEEEIQDLQKLTK